MWVCVNTQRPTHSEMDLFKVNKGDKQCMELVSLIFPLDVNNGNEGLLATFIADG